MKRKHRSTLALIFARPVSANIPWRDIEALFAELGAEISEREALASACACSVSDVYSTARTLRLKRTRVPWQTFAIG